MPKPKLRKLTLPDYNMRRKHYKKVLSHPLTSNGKMKDKKEMYDKKLSDYIDKITKPIFNRVLQETPKNHTMVDKPIKSIKKTVTPSLYNCHNYRLYFNFTKEKYKPKEGMVGVWFGKFKNYGKEFTAVGEGVRITIKRTKVEVINKQNEEQWHYINRIKAKEEIKALLNKIDQKCINSFKKFIEVYGGCSDYAIVKAENRPNLNLFTQSDNKVMKEPFIDNLPLNMQFETPIVKKVYKKPNVEYKQPIYAATYLENSGLKEFAPEISNSIRELTNVLTPTIADLNYNLKTHISVLKGIDKSFKRFNKLLNQKSLRKWL